jgi:hypothetical protein
MLLPLYQDIPKQVHFQVYQIKASCAAHYRNSPELPVCRQENLTIIPFPLRCQEFPRVRQVQNLLPKFYFCEGRGVGKAVKTKLFF